MEKFVYCQCCGKKYKTRPFGTDMYTICPNCNWEQDPFVNRGFEASAANMNMSINKARLNIECYGNIYGEKRKWYQRKVKLYV